MSDFFTKNYKKYYKNVYLIIYSHILNIYDTEDIVQKTFTKFYQNINNFDKNDDYIKKWLFKVAINEMKNHLKSYWNKNRVDIDYLENISEQETKLHHNELLTIMDGINKEYRIPIYLFFYEGYSVKEIAEIMNLSESCIKTRLKRGKEKLKIEMEKI